MGAKSGVLIDNGGGPRETHSDKILSRSQIKTLHHTIFLGYEWQARQYGSVAGSYPDGQMRGCAAVGLGACKRPLTKAYLSRQATRQHSSLKKIFPEGKRVSSSTPPSPTRNNLELRRKWASGFGPRNRGRDVRPESIFEDGCPPIVPVCET